LKSNHLIALLTSIILILVLVATSCTPSGGPTVTVTVTPKTTATTTSTSTPVAAKEMTYRAMNPAGIFIPVQTVGLAPRLTTIVGKTLYICQGEADPVIMPALYKAMVAKFPTTKFLYYDVSAFGPNTPGTGTTPAASTGLPEPTDILTKVDAVIRGIGW
jgi:hypothetical protein